MSFTSVKSVIILHAVQMCMRTLPLREYGLFGAHSVRQPLPAPSDKSRCWRQRRTVRAHASMCSFNLSCRKCAINYRMASLCQKFLCWSMSPCWQSAICDRSDTPFDPILRRLLRNVATGMNWM